MNGQALLEILKRELNLPANTVAVKVSVGVGEPTVISCTYIHRPAPQVIKEYLRG